jgi:hypothetical protein
MWSPFAIGGFTIFNEGRRGNVKCGVRDLSRAVICAIFTSGHATPHGAFAGSPIALIFATP